MKREYVDFHAVPDHLLHIHNRMLNWARWVKVHHSSGWIQHPMWRQTLSQSRQWHTPEYRETCDLLDADIIEKTVRNLAHEQKIAVRWRYISGNDPRGTARKLGMTPERMLQVIHNALQKIDQKEVDTYQNTGYKHSN